MGIRVWKDTMIWRRGDQAMLIASVRPMNNEKDNVNQ